MDAPSPAQCTGSPTFNLANPGTNQFSEWPSNIPGLICKAAPFGYYASPRFSQCCSGKVYNITTPTNPDDPAYPVSCALFCQVDPELNEINDRYPYGFSEHFMCLNDGKVNGGEEGMGGAGEVVCATVTAENGDPIPTSYESSWTGDWQTRSYVRQDAFGLSWTWVNEGETYSPWSSETTAISSPSTLSDASMTSSSETTAIETSTGSMIITEDSTKASSTGEESETAATITEGDSTDDAVSLSCRTLGGVMGVSMIASFLMS